MLLENTVMNLKSVKSRKSGVPVVSYVQDCLADITKAFQEDEKLLNLLLSPTFVEKVQSTVDAARELVSYAAENGIPVPGLSNSLTYFDAYTSSRLPLNMIQAQRDYFGSHTYERLDRDGVFHTEWEA